MGNLESKREIEELTGRVIGCAVTVHRALGPGYLEAVYQRALSLEFHHRGISFEPQAEFEICYRGRVVGEGRADFIVEDRLVVEIKAVENLTRVHQAQVISYLKASGLTWGLLLNFNSEVLKHGIRRLFWRRPGETAA